jgi:tetratricopeptide (TPR) repeat protein
MDSPHRVVYETETRLSDSLLWKLQEHYYSQCGQEAWDHIPFYPTSNPYIGETYAELIVSVLLDVADTLTPEAPIYILELATGTGTFSYYLLKELVAKAACFSALRPLRFCYVMTDFTANNVEAWKANPMLQPFLEAGQLDFAVYRPEDDDQLFLHLAQQPLKAGAVLNPLFAIANYFFDSIHQDVFQVSNHHLSEVCLTWSAAFNPPADPPVELYGSTAEQARLMGRLEKTESYRPAVMPYYEDPVMNQVLNDYAKFYEKGSILFPLGALRCVQNLLRLSSTNLVLISSDKGFTDTDYMQGHFAHNITPHHGAFSYMVNYNAIGQYFEKLGGVSLLTQERNPILSTALCARIAKAPGNPLERTTYAFQQKLHQQNKLNDLYYCQSFIFAADERSPSDWFNSYMAMLRVAHFDPIIFCGLADKLYDTLHGLDTSQRTLLLEALDRVKGNLYSVRPEHNALFWMGKLYYGLSMVEEAMATFQASVDRFGETECYSMYHLGACSEFLKNYPEALAYFQKAQKVLTDCELTAGAVTRMAAKVAELSPQSS